MRTDIADCCCRYDESLWRRLDMSGRSVHRSVLGRSILGRGVEYLRLARTEVCIFAIVFIASLLIYTLYAFNLL